ncbi:MAG: Fic family protein [Clostridia bacterium]|nr:Fic family protein [Clostridia bacterium]
MNTFEEIQILLREKAELQVRINMIPYDGSPEVKENTSGKYLYIRKRIGSRLTSTYVDVYSDDLYQLLLRNARELRELRKALRKADRRLSELGYEKSVLPARILENLDFARANMKSNIYYQAVLEGVATSFPQTEDIIENGTVNGMTATDIQKILNLKHAWEFILDNDVIQFKTDLSLLSYIAKLVNEGFFTDGGRVRSVPVTIGGSTYRPKLPIEADVKDEIKSILEENRTEEDIAIDLMMYCMKSQIFIDGNKRAAVILANHYLIAHGKGLIVIPEVHVPEFKKKLVSYYEGEDIEVIRKFLKENCWKKF